MWIDLTTYPDALSAASLDIDMTPEIDGLPDPKSAGLLDSATAPGTNGVPATVRLPAEDR